MSVIMARMREPSTWRGITGIAAIFGVVIAPELQEAITVVALSVVSLIEILRKEKK